jgi:hypothetical protein
MVLPREPKEGVAKEHSEETKKKKRERKKNHKPPDEAEDYHLLWHLLFPDKEFPSGRK